MIEFRCSNIKCQRPADFKKYVGRTPGGHEIVKKVPELKCPRCNSDIRPLPE